MSDEPRVGDKVYSNDRFNRGKGEQPNGKITVVMWGDGTETEYLVEFYDEPRTTQDTFDRAQLEYSSNFGGTWYIG